MTNVYATFTQEDYEENEGNIAELLIGGAGAFYPTMDALLDDDNMDGDPVFVLEVIDEGKVKMSSKFVSNSTKEIKTSKKM